MQPIVAGRHLPAASMTAHQLSHSLQQPNGARLCSSRCISVILVMDRFAEYKLFDYIFDVSVIAYY